MESISELVVGCPLLVEARSSAPLYGERIAIPPTTIPHRRSLGIHLLGWKRPSAMSLLRTSVSQDPPTPTPDTPSRQVCLGFPTLYGCFSRCTHFLASHARLAVCPQQVG